ncbi:hypothetical protein L911_1118 [Vibrio fluvialis I21563]|nr:hypothetical protein L911_1118 [Vibrio fluvialis I21563]
MNDVTIQIITKSSLLKLICSPNSREPIIGGCLAAMNT